MTTEEFLAERRLRAAELALESARRRVTEADEEIETLRRQVALLEERVLAAAERAGGERAALRAELESERRLRHRADQSLWSERERARSLEDELRRRVDALATPAAERRLAEVEQRTRQVRAELELVRHRAAEFEQQVRLAVDAAWRWLGETGERVSAALLDLDALRAEPPSNPVSETQSMPAASPGDVIPDRFDEALSRLRAQVQPEPGPPD